MAKSKGGFRDPTGAILIGKRIRDRAEELRVSFTDLAESAEIPYKTLMNYVYGMRTPDPLALAKIAAQLSTTVDDLVSTTQYLPIEDPKKSAAMRRIIDEVMKLPSNDCDLIADIAMTITERRQNQRDKGPILSEKYLKAIELYETVIPGIIRHYQPIAITVATTMPLNDAATLTLELKFKPGSDLAERRRTIERYLKNELRLSRGGVSAITDAQSAIFQMVIGTKQQPSAPQERRYVATEEPMF
jgi:transcriptional regulator with XRE-family HTH domain